MSYIKYKVQHLVYSLVCRGEGGRFMANAMNAVFGS